MATTPRDGADRHDMKPRPLRIARAPTIGAISPGRGLEEELSCL